MQAAFLSLAGQCQGVAEQDKRAVLLAEGPLLELADLEMNKQADDVIPVSTPIISPLKDEKAEMGNIINALTACNGHREQAARLLNVNPATLYRKMKKYGLK